VQDIGHALGGYKPLRASMSRTLFSLAGFQVITIGRFWVIAEGISDHVWSIEELCSLLPKVESAAKRADKNLLLKALAEEQ
ncbi:MAG: hypothetical protein WCC87_10740, partial [Candidatus Korobacteraceae bacterium]